jgi:hypothetical protein
MNYNWFPFIVLLKVNFKKMQSFTYNHNPFLLVLLNNDGDFALGIKSVEIAILAVVLSL